ncbi:hypothetical protein ACFX1Q_044537 [Malus domestica]
MISTLMNKQQQQLFMEKSSVAGKCHKQLGFALITSFLSFFVLILFNFSDLSAGRNNTRGITFLINNFGNVIFNQRPHSSSLPLNGTLNATNSSTTTTTTHAQSSGRVTKAPVQPISDEIEKNNAGFDSDSCSGRYVYVYDLPKRFNQDLLKNCHSLMKWTDMCPHLSNMGLGPKIHSSTGKLVGNGWFATNQFSLGVIFHNRMKQYRCLTNDSSLASAVFVPFYAGLDVGRYLWDCNTSVRDASPLELVKWLSRRPEWKTMWGRDHFIVGGRIGWDFRRKTDDDSDWGSKLMLLPETKNMTMLSIEASCWNNDHAIPYPTYFHPSKDSEVFEWQRRMRKRKRRHLFSFAGAPRPDLKIRDLIIDQCKSSSKCKLVGCYKGAIRCDDPLNVMEAFQGSVFCLQPPGDSYTRRSTFDSILAGCIPVFFRPGSAYAQYLWHFPNDPSKYSVFISENDIKDKKAIINKMLLRIPKHQVAAMREEVIRLIPKVIYADPRAPRLNTVEDAFDIAVKGVLDKVDKTRKDMKEGKDPGNAFWEINPAKFDMPKLAKEGEKNTNRSITSV